MLDLAIDDRIFLSDPVDCAMQELDLIFHTTNTELIGYPDFGTNFEQFLWEMTPSESDIKRYVDERILSTLYLRKMHIDTSVEILQGNVRDIYYITVKVEDPRPDSVEKPSRQRIYQYQ